MPKVKLDKPQPDDRKIMLARNDKTNKGYYAAMEHGFT
jgi:hypothetical protein